MLHLVLTFSLGMGFQGSENLLQNPPPPSSESPRAVDQTLLGDQESQVFLSNEIGISMKLPPNSTVTTRRSGQNPFYMVRDGAKQPSWSLRLESVASNDPSAEAMVRRRMLSQDRNESSIEILKEQAVNVDGTPGYLSWVREQLPNGNDVVFGLHAGA